MKVNILAHLPNKTFLNIYDCIRSSLFDWNKSTLTLLAKKLDIPLKNLSRYRNGTRPISLGLFFKLMDLSEKNLSYFQDKMIIKVGKSGRGLNVGPFIEINPDWIYISELIRGDGCLSRGHNNSYHLVFTNTDLGLIDFVKRFFLGLGIDKRSICIYSAHKHPHVKHLVVNSEIVSYLFNSLFLIPFGRKEKMILPSFITKNKDFAISGVRGIFDAEGSVFIKSDMHYSRRVSIVSFDKNYLTQIQHILNKLNIHSKIYKEKREKHKDFHRLHITERDSIFTFKDTISPLHKKRRKKLEDLLESYDGMWNSKTSLYSKILVLLSEGKTRSRDLSDSLSISIINLAWFLQSLRRKKLIKVTDHIRSNKGSWFIYDITSDGRDYLKTYSDDFS
jgi:hypothetical protein